MVENSRQDIGTGGLISTQEAPVAGSGSRLWTELARNDVHGPLPILLLVLTTATGLVDAVSILALGRVFVANMTGNVVFVGFALAGAPGFSLVASLAALAGFLVGAFAGGPLVERWSGHRGKLLRNATAIEFGLVVVGLACAVLLASTPGVMAAAVVAAFLAVAMGLQNAAVRRLAVPDLTTTVLTMTLTGIAADGRKGGYPTVARRVLAVLTMLVGALVGALLVLHVGLGWALGFAAVLLAIVALVATLRSRRAEGWHVRGAG
ncbi:YoaK family protein [Pseudonocardia xinjiangensis]|uniref:YoaK family protein n=1 Tax=Pseudonocardia xinjiangensis TaxID=75289 RepID=UPI003D94BCED